MYSYEFTLKAFKDLKKLPQKTQSRIIKKLDYYVSSKDPVSFADRLINWELGEYRFRVGLYRVVFDLEGEKIVVIAVGHRREIYR